MNETRKGIFIVFEFIKLQHTVLDFFSFFKLVLNISNRFPKIKILNMFCKKTKKCMMN